MLSCYGLTYEPGHAASSGLTRVVRADPDLEADMYETTIDVLAAAGLAHYEISNFARPLSSAGTTCGTGTTSRTSAWDLPPRGSSTRCVIRTSRTRRRTWRRFRRRSPGVEEERLPPERRAARNSHARNAPTLLGSTGAGSRTGYGQDPARCSLRGARAAPRMDCWSWTRRAPPGRRGLLLSGHGDRGFSKRGARETGTHWAVGPVSCGHRRGRHGVPRRPRAARRAYREPQPISRPIA